MEGGCEVRLVMLEVFYVACSMQVLCDYMFILVVFKVNVVTLGWVVPFFAACYVITSRTTRMPKNVSGMRSNPSWISSQQQLTCSTGTSFQLS